MYIVNDVATKQQDDTYALLLLNCTRAGQTFVAQQMHSDEILNE